MRVATGFFAGVPCTLLAVSVFAGDIAPVKTANASRVVGRVEVGRRGGSSASVVSRPTPGVEPGRNGKIASRDKNYGIGQSKQVDHANSYGPTMMSLDGDGWRTENPA